jgi:predicted transcriptional regulator
MADDGRGLQGETQLAVMRAAWRTGGGTVDDIRDALPPEYQSGYTTIQTLLNRLAERGLLERIPGRTARGPSAKIVYRPTLSEEDYLADSLERTLEGATPEARQLAITQLIGRLVADAQPQARRRGSKKKKKKK